MYVSMCPRARDRDRQRIVDSACLRETVCVCVSVVDIGCFCFRSYFSLQTLIQWSYHSEFPCLRGIFFLRSRVLLCCCCCFRFFFYFIILVAIVVVLFYSVHLNTQVHCCLVYWVPLKVVACNGMPECATQQLYIAIIHSTYDIVFCFSFALTLTHAYP